MILVVVVVRVPELVSTAVDPVWLYEQLVTGVILRYNVTALNPACVCCICVHACMHVCVRVCTYTST